MRKAGYGVAEAAKGWLSARREDRGDEACGQANMALRAPFGTGNESILRSALLRLLVRDVGVRQPAGQVHRNGDGTHAHAAVSRADNLGHHAHTHHVCPHHLHNVTASAAEAKSIGTLDGRSSPVLLSLRFCHGGRADRQMDSRRMYRLTNRLTDWLVNWQTDVEWVAGRNRQPHRHTDTQTQTHRHTDMNQP